MGSPTLKSCPACGGRISGEAWSCPHCGDALPVARSGPPALGNCAACGGRVSGEARTCPHCGHPQEQFKRQIASLFCCLRGALAVACVIALVLFIRAC